VLLAPLSALVQCRQPTEITLDVTSDAPCPLEHTEVSAAAAAADLASATPRVTTSRCLVTPSGAEIGSLVLVPNGDSNALVALGVRTTLADGRSITARRVLRYVAHTPLTLPIFLETSCAGIECSATDTCRAGVCVSASVECSGGSCDLVADAGVDGAVALDATATDGAMDAAVTDSAGGPDAGVSDVGVADAFTTDAACAGIGQPCSAAMPCCATLSCTFVPPAMQCGPGL
jgi:hypothetical protein